MIEAIQVDQVHLDKYKSNAVKDVTLTSFLKWAGGKENELKHIIPMIPPFNRYYEPFIGGGAVFFALQSKINFINDKSSELIRLYKLVAENDSQFFHTLDVLHLQWQYINDLVDAHKAEFVTFYNLYSRGEQPIDNIGDSLFGLMICHVEELKTMFCLYFDENVENFFREIKKNLIRKIGRMKKLEHEKGKLSDNDVAANIESALKSAFYMHLRHLYNRANDYQIPPSCATAIFFFVRENAYASMFRYNRYGYLNVPYGGISYNRKDLKRKINYMRSSAVQQHLANTMIENMDFEDFLQKYSPQANDFIFLDPPYDSKFSTYTQNLFSQEDQVRLARYLLYQCKAKFMLVIKKTPMISQLYENNDLHIHPFHKRYLVSFQDRNHRESEHLLITNYTIYT